MSESKINGRTHEPNQREVVVQLDALEQLVETKDRAIRELIDERDRRYDDRYTAQEKAIGKAEAAQLQYNIVHNDLSRKMDQQYERMIPLHQANEKFTAIHEKVNSNFQTLYDKIGESNNRQGATSRDWVQWTALILISLGALVVSLFAMMR